MSILREKLEGTRALVTGGAGFIGSHICRALLAHGAIPIAVDNLVSGHRHNIPEGVDLIEASITDASAVESAVSGCRYIFHEAAMVSVPESIARSRECAEVNTVGTEVVCHAAVNAGVERLLFAASAAAYGNEPDIPCREDATPEAWSPYAASKIAGEQILKAHARAAGLSCASLRYFNVFGPCQDPKSPYAAVISAFADRMAHNEPVSIFGDGEQTRDFIFIDDVVSANLLAATTDRPLAGDVINIGTGRAVSLSELERSMRRIIGSPHEPIFQPERPGDIRHSRADASRAVAYIGFEPKANLIDGLKETIRWAREDNSA